MSVGTILRSKGDQVITVVPSSTIGEAAWIMRQCNIGALVVAENEKVRGLLTQRDLVNGLAEYGSALALVESRSQAAREAVAALLDKAAALRGHRKSPRRSNRPVPTHP